MKKKGFLVCDDLLIKPNLKEINDDWYSNNFIDAVSVNIKLSDGTTPAISTSNEMAETCSDTRRQEDNIIGGKPGESPFRRAWMQVGENAFQAAYHSIEKLESAFYKVAFSQAKHDYIYNRFPIQTDRIIDFQHSFIKRIEDFCVKFWAKKDIYRKKGLIHKAGLLFYGNPGNGKTTICLNAIKHVLQHYNGIAIQTDNLIDLSPILNQIREIQPDVNIIVLLEEIDRLIYNYGDRYLLQLLDGADSINDVLYLATTNYIEKIEDNLKNRPSRFNRVWEVLSPDANARKEFILNKLDEEELASINLEQWIKDTNHFSLDHLKELLNAVFIFGDPYDETVKTISGMCKIKNTENAKRKEIKII